MENEITLTSEELKPFAIASVKKHLKAITKSSNYFVKVDNYSFCICYKTQKYLLPIDKQYNRDYTVISKYTYFNKYEVNELIHSLILCEKLKNSKENNMPLHIFIKEVISFVSMCSSMLAYYTDEKYFTSRELYDLPELTKRKIFMYMQAVKKQVNTGIGTDSEGNSYNSIIFENAIEVK